MSVERIAPSTETPHVDKEFLYVAGGVALGVLAAGMVLASPTIRRVFGKTGLESIVSAVAPDVERYFRLRAM